MVCPPSPNPDPPPPNSDGAERTEALRPQPNKRAAEVAFQGKWGGGERLLLIVTPPLFSATLYEGGGGEPPLYRTGIRQSFQIYGNNLSRHLMLNCLYVFALSNFCPQKKSSPPTSPMTRIIDERDRDHLFPLGLGQKRTGIHRRSFPSIPFHRRRRRRMTATTPLEPTRSSPSPQTAQSATPPQRPT